MDNLSSFSSIAQKLARNPLGIIALFIVLIYAIACLTFGMAKNLPIEVIYYFSFFIMLYPLIVLVAFYRLVTKHHTKLYAPEDFPRAEDFLACLYGTQSRVLTKREADRQKSAIPPSEIAGERQ